MTQSMSRVAHCIDNGPMEDFWGILKRERYYGRQFTSKRELIQTIENYIHYYNTRRVQRNLGMVSALFCVVHKNFAVNNALYILYISARWSIMTMI